LAAFEVITEGKARSHQFKAASVSKPL